MGWRPDGSLAAKAALSLLVVACTILNDETEALKLLGLKVPGLVQNGTEESVVLDCLYDLGDKKAEGMNHVSSLGLVVKWYFQGDPRPVYQWIPTHPPQAQGRLRGRLDLGYRATDDEATMHRALFIRRPTVDLSGQYTCKVSTFEEDKSLSETMVVYVPEKSMKLSRSKPRDDVVTVSCRAKGVYPEPNVTLYMERRRGAALDQWREKMEASHEEGEEGDEGEEEEDEVDIDSLSPLEGVNVQTTMTDEGLFDVEAWAEVSDRYLMEGADSENHSPIPVFFHCLLGIPHSEYSRRARIHYFPGPSTTPSTVTMESSFDESDGSSAVPVAPTWYCFLLMFALTASQHLAGRS